MNLHFANKNFQANQIVALLDLDAVTVEKATRDLLMRAQAEGLLVDCCNGELPRSLVLTHTPSDGCAYHLAAPNTSTLHKKMSALKSAGANPAV